MKSWSFLRDAPRIRSSGFLLVLAGVVFAVGQHRIGFGIDVSDEGFYLSAPMRYALGDLPFRDEFINAHRMFDLILWPVFELFPAAAVYELRLGWLLVQLACVVCLWSVFRRFAPGPVVGLACAATLYIPNLIWTPGYHVMGAFFFTLSWSLWLTGCLATRATRQAGAGAAGGLAFAAASLSYLPMLALGCVPAAVFIWRLRGSGRGAAVVATAAFLATLALVGSLALAALIGSGLLPDWLEAQARVLEYGRYASGILDKLLLFGRQGLLVLPILGAVALFVASMLVACRSPSRIGRLAKSPTGIALLCGVPLVASLLGVGPLLFGEPDAVRLGWFYGQEVPFHLAAASTGLHLGAWIARVGARGRSRSVWEPQWRLVYLSTASASLLLAGFFGILSGQAFKTMFAIVPIAVSGIVLVHRELAASAGSAMTGLRASAVATSLALALALPSYAVRLLTSYREGAVADLRTEFSHPRLVGIRSSELRVRALEAVSEHVSARVQPGERLLIAGDAPLLYYLTSTRPALDHTWTASDLAGDAKRESLRKMVAGGRTPRVAIRLEPRRLEKATSRAQAAMDYPIQAFIVRNYQPVLRLGNVDVWHRRSAGSRDD